MGNIVGMFNNKGGVGKTSVTLNVAYELSRVGKVLIVDFDGQGNSSEFFDLRDAGKMYELFSGKESNAINIVVPTTYKNIDVIPSSARLNDLEADFASDELGTATDFVERVAKAKKTLANAYDYIIVDLPPTFATMTKVMLTYFCDSIIVVSTATTDSAFGLSHIVEAQEQCGFAFLGILFNDVIKKYNKGKPARVTVDENEVIEFVKNAVGDKMVFKNQIKHCNAIKVAKNNKKFAREYWNGKATQIFADVANEIIERIGV